MWNMNRMRHKYRAFSNYLLSLLLNHPHRQATQQIHSQLIITNATSHNLLNLLIRQYSLGDYPQEALTLYKHLQHQTKTKTISFDSFAFSFLIKSCANSENIVTASQLHCLTTKLGFGVHVYVQTALLNMYGVCGCLGDAKKVFAEMPVRNSVTWNALITGLTKWGEVDEARALFEVMPGRNVVSWTGIIDGYARMGKGGEALFLFRRMMREGVKLTELTMLVIFPAVWNIGCVELCQSIHGYGEKCGFNVSDVRVSNSLIDAYAKCGSIESALKVFEWISEEKRNLVSWTSIISGCAMYGMIKEVVELFEEMKNLGFKPSRITFLSILNACSHGGLVDEGLDFFRNMVNECGIQPDIKHYGCLVDMLGRAGRLDEAEKMALDIPTEIVSDVIWRTLLGACSFHGDAERGERVLGKLLEMKRECVGDYVLLSNIFVGVGRYADSERVRRAMDEQNAVKVPGRSLV